MSSRVTCDGQMGSDDEDGMDVGLGLGCTESHR